MNSNRKGFTLIELLVVVLIIGILASIAIPQYFKVVEKARVSEAMSLIAAIKSAQERYLAKGGVYTNSLNDLDISYANMTATSVVTKFFTAGSVTLGNSTVSGGPSYSMTVTRHTNNATVAARYAGYTLTFNVPDSPQVSCTGTNAANCAELLQ